MNVPSSKTLILASALNASPCNQWRGALHGNYRLPAGPLYHFDVLDRIRLTTEGTSVNR